MSWRTWKTITFSPGKPNAHQESNMPMNVSAFFPESSFSVRISSPAECPCVSGKRAGQSLNHKPPERDPDAASLRLPRTSSPGACLGAPSARFPNGTRGWPGAGGMVQDQQHAELLQSFGLLPCKCAGGGCAAGSSVFVLSAPLCFSQGC